MCTIDFGSLSINAYFHFLCLSFFRFFGAGRGRGRAQLLHTRDLLAKMVAAHSNALGNDVPCATLCVKGTSRKLS